MKLRGQSYAGRPMWANWFPTYGWTHNPETGDTYSSWQWLGYDWLVRSRTTQQWDERRRA